MADSRVVVINRRISSLTNTFALEGIHKGEWFITQDSNILYWKNPVTGKPEQIAGRSDGAVVSSEVSSISNTSALGEIKSGEMFIARDENAMYWKNPNNDDSVEPLGGKSKLTAVKLLGAGLMNLDLLKSGYFYTEITANSTFSVSNTVTTDDVVTNFVLEVKNGGQFALTWWNEVEWEYGTAPTLSPTGTTLLGFYGIKKAGTLVYKWKGVVLAYEY